MPAISRSIVNNHTVATASATQRAPTLTIKDSTAVAARASPGTHVDSQVTSYQSKKIIPRKKCVKRM